MPVSSDPQRRLGANVRTLRDLNSFFADPSSSSNHYDASYSTNNSNNHPRKGNAHDPATAAAAAASVPMSIHHIPHLPNADQALGMLQRLHKEFYPIVVRRGYKVLSLSEMCCCGDGQDNKNNNNRRTKKSGRTTRMNQNVLGYNQGERSNGTNTHHRIHIRLRETASNKSSAGGADHTAFYSYEHVAGTMSHELAHCDVGPHNVKFYKLMDDIQEQHAIFLTNRVVTDGSGFPLNSPQAHVLGSGGDNAARTSSNRTGAAAAQAAIQRQHKRNQRRNTCTCLPQKLGGNSKMAQWMLPGQAAAMAAETRCLQDEQWCQSWHPIHPNVNHTIVGKRARPNQNYPPIALGNTMTTMTATKRKATATALTIDTATAATNAATGRRNAEGFLATPFAETIDLTCCNDDDDDEEQKENHTRGPIETGSFALEHMDLQQKQQKWICHQCTFYNELLALTCGMCFVERQTLSSSETVAVQMVRDEAIQRVKETEVERAERDFGFNIYGG